MNGIYLKAMRRLRDNVEASRGLLDVRAWGFDVLLNVFHKLPVYILSLWTQGIKINEEIWKVVKSSTKVLVFQKEKSPVPIVPSFIFVIIFIKNKKLAEFWKKNQCIWNGILHVEVTETNKQRGREETPFIRAHLQPYEKSNEISQCLFQEKK